MSLQAIPHSHPEFDHPNSVVEEDKTQESHENSNQGGRSPQLSHEAEPDHHDGNSPQVSDFVSANVDGLMIVVAAWRVKL